MLSGGNHIDLADHFMFVSKAISRTEIQIFVSHYSKGFDTFTKVRMPIDYAHTDHFKIISAEKN